MRCAPARATLCERPSVRGACCGVADGSRVCPLDAAVHPAEYCPRQEVAASPLGAGFDTSCEQRVGVSSAPASAVGLAGDGHDGGVVEEAVKTGGGQKRIAEDLGKLVDGAVGGDEDGAAFVALIDDVVEILGGGRAQGFETEIVEDEQIGAGDGLQAAFVAAIRATGCQGRQQASATRVDNVVAAFARLPAKGLRKVTFPHPAWANDDDGLMPGNELAGGQFEDELLVELGIEREIEALEGPIGLEGRPAKTQAELLLTPALQFVLEEAFEELEIGPLAIDGLAQTSIEGLENPRQAQQLEMRAELGIMRGGGSGRVHDRTVRGSRSAISRAKIGRGCGAAGGAFRLGSLARSLSMFRTVWGDGSSSSSAF